MRDYKFAIILGVLVIVVILVAYGLERSKSGSDANSPAPYDLVTTFKGAASTSRAFTWYTSDSSAAGILEIVKGQVSSFCKYGCTKGRSEKQFHQNRQWHQRCS